MGGENVNNMANIIIIQPTHHKYMASRTLLGVATEVEVVEKTVLHLDQHFHVSVIHFKLQLYYDDPKLYKAYPHKDDPSSTYFTYTPTDWRPWAFVRVMRSIYSSINLER